MEKLIEWQLDDIIGDLRRISLVTEPAIDEDFMLFNSIDLKFKTLNEEKKIITGPAMRADIKIPRKDERGELYWGFFSKDTVRQAAELFFRKNSNANKTNLEHEFEIDGVFVFESWIVDNPEMDKSKGLGFSAKEGDWFVSMKVENDVVWNNYLKTGLIRGFSVEIRAREEEVDLFKKLEDILNSNDDEDTKFEKTTSLLFQTVCR